VFYSKGIHVLIDAISKLPSDINISVKIVGNDHDGYTEKMKEKATSLGLDDKIEFTGVRLDVPELLADADIFIHPAVCEEGFGITLAEAMASYLPCIAFKRGAIPEIIDNGENGFVIDRISADLLAKTIEDAYNLFKTDDYDQYKINARKKAEFFSVENALCQLEGIYYE
jgi:glycosyltransferase involved in cell wall biosynthesis